MPNLHHKSQFWLKSIGTTLWCKKKPLLLLLTSILMTGLVVWMFAVGASDNDLGKSGSRSTNPLTQKEFAALRQQLRGIREKTLKIDEMIRQARFWEDNDRKYLIQIQAWERERAELDANAVKVHDILANADELLAPDQKAEIEIQRKAIESAMAQGRDFAQKVLFPKYQETISPISVYQDKHEEFSKNTCLAIFISNKDYGCIRASNEKMMPSSIMITHEFYGKSRNTFMKLTNSDYPKASTSVLLRFHFEGQFEVYREWLWKQSRGLKIFNLFSSRVGSIALEYDGFRREVNSNWSIALICPIEELIGVSNESAIVIRGEVFSISINEIGIAAIKKYLGRLPYGIEPDEGK